jgi:hypothetical protein
MPSSRKEIRDHCLRITDTEGSTMETLANDFINDTLNEINDPGWAFAPRKELQHNWSWLRRKHDITTVSGTTDYVLPRDVDRIAIVRQETTPAKLRQVSDRRFYLYDAKRDESGTPVVYRLWEVSGVSTKLATADTIDVVSSSSSDGSDTELAVTVWGYVSGIIRNETYALNGTTEVTGSLTFQADDIFVSKQKDTTGIITVTENSGGDTLVVLSPTDRNPLFKVMSLYPIPDAAITVNLEYYTRIRELTNDSDVPQFDSKWHHAVTKGVLAKIYQHLGKETETQAAIAMYRSTVRSMVASDTAIDDYIPNLMRHYPNYPQILVTRTTDDIS